MNPLSPKQKRSTSRSNATTNRGSITPKGAAGKRIDLGRAVSALNLHNPGELPVNQHMIMSTVTPRDNIHASSTSSLVNPALLNTASDNNPNSFYM